MSNPKPRNAKPGLVESVIPWVLLSILIIATEFLYRHIQEQHQQQQLKLTESHARELARALEYELNASVLVTHGLASYIVSNAGKFDEDAIEPWIMPLLTSNKHFRNIGIAPANTVTYVFPLEGNEKVIGFHYPRDRKQWPAIETIILSRKPVLAGPVSLVQGGQGLIYRLPIYVDRHYWGLLGTVIDADSLFSEIQQQANQMGVQAALIDGRENRKFWRLLWGDLALIESATTRTKLDIPGRSWQLLAQSQTSPALHSQWPRIFGWCLAILLSALIFLSHRVRKEPTKDPMTES